MRSRTHGAYWQQLLERYGPRRVKIYFDEEKTFIPVAEIVDNQPLGTHLYVCGPAGMIDGVLMTALKAGWPKENLHSERFLAPPPGLPFEVLLEKSGIQITVGEHQSILEAVEAPASMRPTCAAAAPAASAKPRSSPAMARWNTTTSTCRTRKRPPARRS